jgi:hypothetical protein
VEQSLFALPILPGKTEAARAFLHELEHERKGQLAECDQQFGVVKETWAIQQTPQGDLLVAYFVAENIAQAFLEFAASQGEFERWVKQQLQETTGADLNTPPAGPLSEILTDYAA